MLKSQGFRWKQLINDRFTQKKITIFGISREDTESKESIVISSSVNLMRSKIMHKDGLYNRLCELLLLKKEGIDYFPSYEMDADFKFEAVEHQDHALIMKLCYRWNAVKYLNYNQKPCLLHYNSESEEENVFACSFEDNQVYLVATDDPDVSIFFAESKHTPEIAFASYIERILQNCGDKVLLEKPLLVPAFSFQGKSTQSLRST